MKNKKPTVRSVLRVGMISGAAGFINGVMVILAGTSYFYPLSPYSWILGALLLVTPGQFVDRAEHILFRSGLQFILVPLLGMLIGAVIGWSLIDDNFRPIEQRPLEDLLKGLRDHNQ